MVIGCALRIQYWVGSTPCLEPIEKKSIIIFHSQNVFSISFSFMLKYMHTHMKIYFQRIRFFQCSLLCYTLKTTQRPNGWKKLKTFQVNSTPEMETVRWTIDIKLMKIPLTNPPSVQRTRVHVRPAHRGVQRLQGLHRRQVRLII